MVLFFLFLNSMFIGMSFINALHAYGFGLKKWVFVHSILCLASVFAVLGCLEILYKGSL